MWLREVVSLTFLPLPGTAQGHPSGARVLQAEEPPLAQDAPHSHLTPEVCWVL